jgi:hypothetical protein
LDIEDPFFLESDSPKTCLCLDIISYFHVR